MCTFILLYFKTWDNPHPLLIISRGRSRPDSIWGELVDHEGISPLGNKFDISLEVSTQNGNVVRKCKMLLYLPFQLQFHIIAQTFFLILSFLDFFIYFGSYLLFYHLRLCFNCILWNSYQLCLQNLWQRSRFFKDNWRNR